MRKLNEQKKVVVAMSGGVDSSVAAALLKRAGLDVVGVFMKFWKPRINTDYGADSRGFENRCCSSEAEARARKVAKLLKIPFYVFNFEKEFKKRIVDYFLKGYKAGFTPNPCVVCNKEIKFGLLLEKALKLDADCIATGHYALKREIKNQKSKIKNYKLLKARDKNKDQSYFLWMLNQEQLKYILFPVGDYLRSEVEGLAKKFKLPFAGVKKSQEVCFVPAGVSDFLKKYLKEKPGDIVDTQGKVIGEHYGLWFYTIGQRKGIGLPGGPYYVLDKPPHQTSTLKKLRKAQCSLWCGGKDLKKNILIVTKNKNDLEKKELIAGDVNWILGESPKLPLKIMVKIRYRHKSASAIIYSLIPNSKFLIQFAKPQRAITPGQSVVFLKGQEVLGGGIIG